MKRKTHRTKLPILAFEAEAWPVEIKYRKTATISKRSERPAQVASKLLRVASARPARQFAQRQYLSWFASSPVAEQLSR